MGYFSCFSLGKFYFSFFFDFLVLIFFRYFIGFLKLFFLFFFLVAKNEFFVFVKFLCIETGKTKRDTRWREIVEILILFLLLFVALFCDFSCFLGRRGLWRLFWIIFLIRNAQYPLDLMSIFNGESQKRSKKRVETL